MSNTFNLNYALEVPSLGDWYLTKNVSLDLLKSFYDEYTSGNMTKARHEEIYNLLINSQHRLVNADYWIYYEHFYLHPELPNYYDGYKGCSLDMILTLTEVDANMKTYTLKMYKTIESYKINNKTIFDWCRERFVNLSSICELKMYNINDFSIERWLRTLPYRVWSNKNYQCKFYLDIDKYGNEFLTINDNEHIVHNEPFRCIF